jgi:hypothetical protein
MLQKKDQGYSSLLASSATAIIGIIILLSSANLGDNEDAAHKAATKILNCLSQNISKLTNIGQSGF